MTPEQRAAALHWLQLLQTMPPQEKYFSNGMFVADCKNLQELIATELCKCGDRGASACPGEWESGCDLGANEKFAEPVQEPVAWMLCGPREPVFLHGPKPPLISLGWEPLYAAPQQRKPLGLDAIYEIWDQVDDPNGEDILVFARMLEKAHGITGGKE